MNKKQKVQTDLVRLSLEGKIASVVFSLIIFNALIVAVIFTLYPEPWVASISGAFLCTCLGFWIIKQFFYPVNRVLQALIDGMQSFKDGDFSVSIVDDRNDEIGALIKAHNEVKEVLRRERLELSQKELLLETVNQTTPIAMLLVNNNNKVTYSNTSARKMFFEGKLLEGFDFQTLIEQHLPELKEAFSQKADGLYSYERHNEVETFHISWRNFKLHGQRHDLYLIREMTRELNRQEVATWKKVIRVISHELNNSLAPISSLAHSGQILTNRKNALEIDSSEEKITKIFSTIEERANYLKQFIEGYARFAKLPKPQIQILSISEFIANIAQTTGLDHYSLPGASLVRFDPAQIQQVLINLIKNALESGSSPEDINMSVEILNDVVQIVIKDKGSGMTEEQLQNALVPFYSTKAGGSGLGLPLCREIIEAHGGSIQINNRSEGGLQVSLTLPGQSFT